MSLAWELLAKWSELAHRKHFPFIICLRSTTVILASPARAPLLVSCSSTASSRLSCLSFCMHVCVNQYVESSHSWCFKFAHFLFQLRISAPGQNHQSHSILQCHAGYVSVMPAMSDSFAVILTTSVNDHSSWPACLGHGEEIFLRSSKGIS